MNKRIPENLHVVFLSQIFYACVQMMADSNERESWFLIVWGPVRPMDVLGGI